MDMDFEAAREETERAYAEASVEDADLSYLTEEEWQNAQTNARELDDALREEVGDESLLANLLWGVWFTGGPGSAVYGYLASSSRACQSTWYIRTTWRTRSVFGTCNNRSSTIWRVA